MINLSQVEATYRCFTDDLAGILPDGIIQVDLSVLQALGLMRVTEPPQKNAALMTRKFHVLESSDKISLFNHNYLVWVVPRTVDSIPSTLVMIAVMNEETPQLEVAFETRGVYNTSPSVLALLEGFLDEIHENNKMLEELSKAS